jgi:hypothetical protein
VLVTLAVAGTRLSAVRPARWPNTWLPGALLLLWLSWLIATARGLGSGAAGTELPISASHTPLEAWFVGKGLLWALLLVPLLRRSRRAYGSAASSWLFLNGIVAGAAVTLAVVLWERHVFVGLSNLASNFRVTGPFASMNTGGAYLDAYLAFVFPILLIWTLKQTQNAARIAGGLLVFVCGYAILITFSRAALLGLAVGSAVVIAGMLLGQRKSGLGTWIALGVPIALVIGLATIVVGTGFAQQRLAQASKDLDARLQHWSRSLALLADRPAAILLGEGFGQYPTLYVSTLLDRRPPGSYRVMDEGDNRFLRLGSGEASYLDQQVGVRPNTGYRLVGSARFVGDSERLSVALCRKALLYSFGCVRAGIKVYQEPDGWQRFDTVIHSGKIGSAWLGAPIKLSLHNPSARGAVDLQSIGLIDPDGRDLIANGNFQSGDARWLFTTDQRLGWHIDQQFIETFVAQGLLGLAALALLLTALATVIWTAFRGGNLAAIAFAGGLSGFLSVGLLGSTVDAAPTAMLFYLAALSSAILVRGPKRHRRSSQGMSRSDRSRPVEEQVS